MISQYTKDQLQLTAMQMTCQLRPPATLTSQVTHHIAEWVHRTAIVD